MKMFTMRGVWLAVLSFACSLAFLAHGQGDLFPPLAGPPSPSMRTLLQVEPRTPIDRAPFEVTMPGSYYLTGNLDATVTVSSDGVHLDLCGFQIKPGQGDAIEITAGFGRDTVISNGSLVPLAGLAGVNAKNVGGATCRIEKLIVYGGNVAREGIAVGTGCLVLDCDVRACETYGIYSIGGSEIRDCRVTGGIRTGIIAGPGSKIIDSKIENNGGDGLVLTGVGSIVSGNIVKGNKDNYNLSQGNQLNLVISQTPEDLEWPCSAVFAGTLTCSVTSKNGLTVSANDVSIDLGGHALVGPGTSSYHGISQAETYRNLTVRNGKIVNWRGKAVVGGGWAAGMNVLGGGLVVDSIQVATNATGVTAGSKGAVFRASVALANEGAGIVAISSATFDHCVAQGNGDVGLGVGDAGVFDGCSAVGNKGHGIHAAYGSVIRGCAAMSNGSTLVTPYEGAGIHVGIGSSIKDCVVYLNVGDGIVAEAKCTVSGCTSSNNGSGPGGGAGIHLWSSTSSSGNRIEGNTVADNPRGIDVDGPGNLILRNCVRGNTTNFDIVVNNKVGPIVTAPNSPAISGSTGGLGVGSTDPSANICY